ncbi:MAG: riboflavin synthase subunit beta, partial [Polaribacter sp.]
QPRYYKGEGNPYKIEHKLDKFRKTAGKNKGLKTTLSEAIDEMKDKEKKGVNKTILIIVTILTLIFLFIIDFDLSIFKGN